MSGTEMFSNDTCGRFGDRFVKASWPRLCLAGPFVPRGRIAVERIVCHVMSYCDDSVLGRNCSDEHMQKASPALAFVLRPTSACARGPLL